jgi:hypothetical protein
MGGGGGSPAMPTVAAPAPAVSPATASIAADQGQRSKTDKMKGMQQAGVAGGFAGDTGGWTPGSPSLFGGPKKAPVLAPTTGAGQPPMMHTFSKLGGGSLIAT